MNILLDTQVFIWLINSDGRLGKKSLQMVESTANVLYISYLSFFEMTIKAALGKLKFDASVISDLEKMRIVLLAGDQESLAEYQVFDQNNKDPFDNFLISVAKTKKLRFLSSDQKILSTKIKGLVVLDATK